MSLKRALRRLGDRCFGSEFERSLNRAASVTNPRILLYWNRGLGDIALGLCAVIARIRERLPDAHIGVLTRSDLEQAFALTDVDEIRVYAELVRADADGCRQASSALGISPRDYDVVFKRPDPTAWIAADLGHFVPRLRWRAEWNALADRFDRIAHDRPVIAAHVSSETGHFYGYVKDWPVECWRELFSRVGDRQAVQWVLFGHAERGPIERPDVLDLRGQTTLLEVLAILRNRTQILIAVDSGILAMAYYLNQQFPLEVVSLWSDPRQGVLKQAVISPNAGLTHCPLIGDDEDVRRLSVARVEAAVLAALARSSSSLHGLTDHSCR